MQDSHASPLTREQAAVVERARLALEAAKAETDWTPGALAAHLGTSGGNCPKCSSSSDS